MTGDTASTAIDWADRAALAGSAACLVHCLALPVIVAALPALTAGMAVPEPFHLVVLAFAVPAAAFALMQGRKRHGGTWPIVSGAIGIVCLAVGALLLASEAVETVVTVSGSLLLAVAHVGNWRLRGAYCGGPTDAGGETVTTLTHDEARFAA